MRADMKRAMLATLVAGSIVIQVFPVLGREDVPLDTRDPATMNATNITPNMTVSPRLAIGGYDTVAYFTRGKAVPGRLEYQTVWHDARWQFASQDDLDVFIEDPEKYAAQYDGHCAMGVADGSGHKDTVDPEAFTIVNGKLYINHTKYWTTEWRRNVSENISRADKNWVSVNEMPEPDK